MFPAFSIFSSHFWTPKSIHTDTKDSQAAEERQMVWEWWWKWGGDPNYCWCVDGNQKSCEKTSWGRLVVEIPLFFLTTGMEKTFNRWLALGFLKHQQSILWWSYHSWLEYFSILATGNTSFKCVHFPASYVSLQELYGSCKLVYKSCNWGYKPTYWLVPIITRLVTKQAKSWYDIAIGVMGTIFRRKHRKVADGYFLQRKVLLHFREG